jgi:signal transduction histidine kinase
MDTERKQPWWARTIATIGFQQMAHRPPLPQRWAVYCVLAYLVPIVVLEAVPEGTWTYKELSWLTTLAPAFILSLHYGMLGSLVGLIAGTVLYLVVQLVLQLNLMPVNPNVLLPIYISYGALAIAVGWLSQQLHDYYHRMIKAERLAAIGEVAVTIRHEVNNALAAIVGQAGLLKMAAPALSAEDRAGVETILEMANRISLDLRKLTELADAPSATYQGETKMVDLHGATPAEGGAGAA